MAKRTRWYTVCHPIGVACSLASAMVSGTIATNRSDAWKKFLSQPCRLEIETKKYLQKNGYRVRCFYFTYEVAE